MSVKRIPSEDVVRQWDPRAATHVVFRNPRVSLREISVSAYPAFSPSLDFSDARNSQYIVLLEDI